MDTMTLAALALRLTRAAQARDLHAGLLADGKAVTAFLTAAGELAEVAAAAVVTLLGFDAGELDDYDLALLGEAVVASLREGQSLRDAFPDVLDGVSDTAVEATLTEILGELRADRALN